MGRPVWPTNPAGAASPAFPPEVAIHLVKMACERPDEAGRSLSQWYCRDLAEELVARGLVESISAETVRRILSSHHLKPWRFHMWESPEVVRDEAFVIQVQEILELYTRALQPDEMVLSLDEKTAMQALVRFSPTLPPRPGQPNLVEHRYRRKGVVNLLAAFDTRTGHVYSTILPRKRQVEFIAFLRQLDAEIDPSITTIHIICDNLRVHKGKEVLAWLSEHPRFVFHFTPVHCSWMNQVEQWFSILQRRRFRFADCASKEDLCAKIEAFIAQWNQQAHPFNWNSQSARRVMAAVLPSAA